MFRNGADFDRCLALRVCVLMEPIFTLLMVFQLCHGFFLVYSLQIAFSEIGCCGVFDPVRIENSDFRLNGKSVDSA